MILTSFFKLKVAAYIKNTAFPSELAEQVGITDLYNTLHAQCQWGSLQSRVPN